MSNTRHKTYTQDVSCYEDYEEYCARLHMADQEKMDAAVDAVYMAAKILAPHFALIFPYGDGKGGWLMRTLCEEADFDIEPFASAKNKSHQLKPSLRKSVMERDAYRCRHCDSHIDLSVDHIYPKSKGGTDDLDNLQTLCRPCNSKKGVKVVSNEQ
jgi:hypothetical protein